MITTNEGFSSMMLHLQMGVDENGAPQFKDKSYSRIVPMATQEDVYAVGEALASLSSYTLHHIQLMQREDLIRA